MQGAHDLYLVASGHRHPGTVLTNHELEQTIPNLGVGWIDKYLGMATRRVAARHERMADFGIEAVQDALARAGWSGGDLGLIVCGASFLEDLMPARSSVIAQAVNPLAVAFDVNAACSSFLYALATAGGLLGTDPTCERAAVCVVERPTNSADYRDSHSSVFFGDSAGAVLVQRTRPETGFWLRELVLANDATNTEAVRVAKHGPFRHDNRDAFEHVMRLGEQVTLDALGRCGLEVADVTAMVGHQANISVLGSLGKRLGVPWERQWHNFEWAGNQGAAGVLTAFSEGWQERAAELAPGDHVVLNSVGSGYTAGAAVLQWLG